jgi:uncharacterized protein (TIGR02646 family)
MIKIVKGDCPAQLESDCTTLCGEMKIAFDAATSDYMAGKKSFQFTDAYKSQPVRDSLTKSHHNKCCFSEAKFTGDFSHVEHFRPKGRVDELSTNKKQYPGYYWLAYSWDNLFLCKARINSSHKKNYFPLKTGTSRNRTHLDTNLEEPILIDPSKEDPRDFIKFLDNEPYGVDERGKLNIELLGLRHSEFSEARLKKLVELKILRDLVDLLLLKGIDKNEPLIIETIALLKSATSSQAEFSSMAKDFLSGWPHLV